MPTLQEALCKAGRISKDDLQKELQRRESALKPAKAKVRSYDVNGCRTVNEFKQTAKLMLLEDREVISYLIKKVHEKFNESFDGFRKLVWILYSVRENGKDLSDADYKILLNRSFRRAGASPSIGD